MPCAWDTAKLLTLDNLSIMEGDNKSSSGDSLFSDESAEGPVEPKYRVAERADGKSHGNRLDDIFDDNGSVPGNGLFISGYYDGCGSGEDFGGDMVMDRLRSKPRPVAAIFVHAGAGFHSHTNEEYHLEACSRAAQLGMAKMNAGGSAVDAVVEATKCLEDNIITNAGVGSNLCLDGTVECDATVVDHNGRSGAVGACSHVRYPVMLAEKILLESYKVLALRRISPILLVGEGARQYAKEHGIKVVDNEEMVTINARDRWEKWTEELRKATGSPRHSAPSGMHIPGRLDHSAALSTGTFNEGQPDSPQHGADVPCTSKKRTEAAIASRQRQSMTPEAQGPRLCNVSNGSPPAKRIRSMEPNLVSSSLNAPATPTQPSHTSGDQLDRAQAPQDMVSEDEIYDTVGVIAIDYQGHIAAASSSGGIGMKHRGRVGPAALVGIGTAVIPADEGDKYGTTVAAVTSGTGEHMATSMAAYKCAERLYLSTVRGRDGSDVPRDNETKILTSFIDHDFMAHPGVRNQESRPAIGIMAVKKTSRGYYFTFGHNTESFALASFASTDKEPLCTMSRVPETRHGRHRPVAGGLKISI
ncbi:hypothetical protein MCOR02_007060 [Pyricularia oryzae]|uniref:Asparaginase n=2 Tax=Pyricularia TaxID=48558 RepID=A0ABQ8NCM6_PYRGI|nr:hypothetical protein MCOR02_007060 [Pyricularia oryzae]KAI6294910.1 hypothetical protein MCOR33_008073 [Pyricularia grisea]KAI6271608.1 hypothetical protein MCOR26_007738 [Pyricularia oryzae]KAI6330309.1 hypothetical protein MCOR29_001866 [Pyricularia oryzae]KAI6347272.1 hypothetical protein MCOR28_002503 [Pyricularia oryzae]